MRTGWTAMAASVLVLAGAPCRAATPPAPAPLPEPAVSPNAFRLGPTPVAPVDHSMRLDDPLSHLRSGFGGSLIDVFPIESSALRLSFGSKLFGRPGRLRTLDPASLRMLPGFRMPGFRPRRKFTPVALVGYGRSMPAGFTLGVDAGMMMGRLIQAPDRMGRPPRLGGGRQFGASAGGGGPRGGVNPLARVTMLYRF